jgi:autotransporter translocation and assembly factor TamB
VIKLLLGLLVAVVVAWLAATATLFYDGSRQWMLNLVAHYLKTQNIDFFITGLNKNFTHINEIFFKSSEGIELIFRDVSLKRSKFFGRSSVHVSAFTLNGARQEIDMNQKLKELIPLMRTIRIFISKLALGEGVLNIMNKRFTLNGLTYKSQSGGDKLYSKIDNYHVLDILFVWNERGTCTRSLINFDNFWETGGVLFIRNPENAKATYELIAKNKKDNFELEAAGNYNDFMFDITVTNAFIGNEKFAYKFKGNLYLTEKRSNMEIELPLQVLRAHIPPASFCERIFADVWVKCDIKYNFAKESADAKANVVFQRAGKNIGNLTASLHKNVLDIGGNIGWISVFGYDFENFTCSVRNFKKVSAKIVGKGFDALMDISIGDRFLVDNFKLTSAGNGTVQSSRPFVLSNDGECALDFDFTRLEFFSKIMPIGGDGKGSLVYSLSKGVISAQLHSEKLRIGSKKNKLYKLSLKKDGENLKVEARYAKLFNINMSNLKATALHSQLNISGRANNEYDLMVAGKFSDSYSKISLDNCSIASRTHGTFHINDGHINLPEKSCNVLCRLAGAGLQHRGTIAVRGEKNSINVVIDSLNAKEFVRLFNLTVPAGIVDGKLQLQFLADSFMEGNGTFTIHNFIAKKNLANVNLQLQKDGMQITANIRNYRQQQINGNVFLPLAVKSDWSIGQGVRGPSLGGGFSGAIALESIIESSDSVDVRGMLDCDMKISGSLAAPSIRGHATLQKANFILEDVSLRNGNINLTASGNEIVISSGQFTDKHGHRLSISGGGTFLAEDGIPNIKTNIGLKFHNFLLLDSEIYTTEVTGNAAITGLLNDMLISGKINVPKCIIRKVGAAYDGDSDDIIIDNEKHFESKKGKKRRKNNSILKYAIDMDCQNISLIGGIFEMKLAGNLHLTNYKKAPSVMGTLKLRSGSLLLFGKLTTITRGYATFAKEFPFNPTANFICKKNLGNLVAYLEIKNIPQNGVQLHLFSVPHFSKEVIMSHILFGKELKQLDISEAAQLGQAVASIKRSGHIFSIMNTFKKIGIIDTISFTKSHDGGELYANTQTANGAKLHISAGKYINDNVYVSVNKGENGANFEVEVSLTPKIFVKANSSGEAGINWKYRY